MKNSLPIQTTKFCTLLVFNLFAVLVLPLQANTSQQTTNLAWADLPKAVQTWLNGSTDAGNLGSAVYSVFLNDLFPGGEGKVIYDIEFPDNRFIALDDAGNHLFTSLANVQDQPINQQDAPQPIQDWIAQNASGDVTDIFKIDGESGGNASFIYEVHLTNSRVALFDAAGQFLNASTDPWQGESDGGDVPIAFGDMPAEVQGFFNNSSFSSDIPTAQFFIIQNHPDLAPQGTDVYEMEPDGGASLIGVAPDGTHLYSMQFANQVQLTGDDIPQPISDWIQEFFPGATSPDVWEIPSPSGANQKVYEVDVYQNDDDSPWGIFGQNANLLVANYGGQPAPVNLSPVVANVTAMQIPGTKQMQIFYDLQVADNHPCTISVKWSTDNGVTYPLTATAVTGAAGPGIVSGQALEVLWDMEIDWNHQFTQTGRIKITASREALPVGGSGNVSNTGGTSGTGAD